MPANLSIDSTLKTKAEAPRSPYPAPGLPFTYIVFAWRKEGLTPQEFRDHCEDVHVPLIKSLAGKDFPKTHVRRYVQRTNDALRNYPASVLIGDNSDFTYDAFAELTFDSQEAFGRFMATMSSPDVKRKIEEDEEKFVAREKMKAVVISEAVVTTLSD